VGGFLGQAGTDREHGLVRSSAWTWDFSSTQTTTALSGGLRYSPDDVGQLGL